jgi:hypothetical protein
MKSRPEMAKSKQRKIGPAPPALWKTAQVEAPLDAERDSEVIERHLPIAGLKDLHPVRRLWSTAEPKARISLHHLADDLRLTEAVEGFAGLVRRLRTDLDAFDDMRYELRIAAILARGGQRILKLGGSNAGPDVEFISSSGHTCGIACYRARSATDTVTHLRKRAREIASAFFPLFHFHPISGDWLLDVTLPEVPLRSGDVAATTDLLRCAWMDATPGSLQRDGIHVTRAPLPVVSRLPGQRRRAHIRFFFPVRSAEKKRVLAHAWEKIEKERAWAVSYAGVPILAIEESDGLLGGALKDEFSELAKEEGNPLAGILLTSPQTIEDAEWLGGPRSPAALHLHLTTFGPSIRTWAHGYHLVTLAPEHAKEEWSFFETDQGSGSELVRSLHYGVPCVRIASPAAGVEAADDPEFQHRVREALARIDREQAVLAERAAGLIGFLPDY